MAKLLRRKHDVLIEKDLIQGLRAAKTAKSV